MYFRRLPAILVILFSPHFRKDGRGEGQNRQDSGFIPVLGEAWHIFGCHQGQPI